MRDACMLCDVPVIRPGSGAVVDPKTDWLLCPQCRADVQWKVDRAVLQVEAEIMGGLELPRPRRRGRRGSLLALAAGALVIAVGLVALWEAWR